MPVEVERGDALAFKPKASTPPAATPTPRIPAVRAIRRRLVVAAGFDCSMGVTQTVSSGCSCDCTGVNLLRRWCRSGYRHPTHHERRMLAEPGSQLA